MKSNVFMKNIYLADYVKFPEDKFIPRYQI
jgi:hypothetical protein